MPHGRWDLPGSGIVPTSSAGADGSLTTEPPGKPIKSLFELLKMTATSLTLQCEKYRLNVMILHLILFPLFYNRYQFLWTCLVVQMVNNLPAMQETLV